LTHESEGTSKTLDTQDTEDSSEVTSTPFEIATSPLEYELHGAVYLHKEFFKEFFEASSSQEPALDVQAETLKVALVKTPELTEPVGEGNLITYNNANKRWTIHHKITGQTRNS
jgi:hypothetical protein